MQGGFDEVDADSTPSHVDRMQPKMLQRLLSTVSLSTRSIVNGPFGGLPAKLRKTRLNARNEGISLFAAVIYLPDLEAGNLRTEERPAKGNGWTSCQGNFDPMAFSWRHAGGPDRYERTLTTPTSPPILRFCCAPLLGGVAPCRGVG